jgi:hypothetical protein
MVEFSLEVPGRYILVDHALSRVERGAAGYLMVEVQIIRTSFTRTKLPTTVRINSTKETL